MAAQLKYDISEYIHGRCQIFAFALNAALKYPMTFIWDSGYFWDDDGDYFDEGKPLPPDPLVHAYCTRPNGTCVDASGTVTPFEAETEHGDCVEADHREISAADVKDLIKQKHIEGPEPGELNTLVQFINENLDVYRDGTRKMKL